MRNLTEKQKQIIEKINDLLIDATAEDILFVLDDLGGGMLAINGEDVVDIQTTMQAAADGDRFIPLSEVEYAKIHCTPYANGYSLDNQIVEYDK